MSLTRTLFLKLNSINFTEMMLNELEMETVRLHHDSAVPDLGCRSSQHAVHFLWCSAVCDICT